MADEVSEQISRRDFIRQTAVVVGGAALGFKKKDVQQEQSPSPVPEPPIKYKPTPEPESLTMAEKKLSLGKIAEDILNVNFDYNVDKKVELAKKLVSKDFLPKLIEEGRLEELDLRRGTEDKNLGPIILSIAPGVDIGSGFFIDEEQFEKPIVNLSDQVIENGFNYFVDSESALPNVWQAFLQKYEKQTLEHPITKKEFSRWEVPRNDLAGFVGGITSSDEHILGVPVNDASEIWFRARHTNIDTSKLDGYDELASMLKPEIISIPENYDREVPDYIVDGRLARRGKFMSCEVWSSVILQENRALHSSGIKLLPHSGINEYPDIALFVGERESESHIELWETEVYGPPIVEFQEFSGNYIDSSGKEMPYTKLAHTASEVALSALFHGRVYKKRRIV